MNEQTTIQKGSIQISDFLRLPQKLIHIDSYSYATSCSPF